MHLLLDAFGEIEYHKRKWDASVSGGKLKGQQYRRKFPAKSNDPTYFPLSDDEKKMLDRYWGRA